MRLIAAPALIISQTSASPYFQEDGLFKGQSIADVASQLRSGGLSPSDVTVRTVNMGDGDLIVRTRSSLALMQGGIPQSEWNLVDMTGDANTEASIAARLANNGLTNSGVDVLRVTGLGQKASSGTLMRKAMPIELWRVPVPNGLMFDSPKFSVLLGRECKLSIAVEVERDGKTLSTSLVFEGVEAFKCTHMTSRSADMINAAYQKLIDVGPSEWLSERSRLSTNFYEHSKRAVPDFKHLMICFDDGPCYEFICTGFRISDP